MRSCGGYKFCQFETVGSQETLRAVADGGLTLSAGWTRVRSGRNACGDERAHPFLGFFLFLIAFGATACVQSSSSLRPVSSASQWHEFQGTWTAAGSRDTLRLQGSRKSSTSRFTGALLLAGPSRPAIGFRSEAIIFNDSETGLVGRSVWTDERGDQVYSDLHGGGAVKADKINGTFVGGTGRYSGARGSYDFAWRFVIENEDGVVQGQSVGLTGRIWFETPASSAEKRNP